MLLRVLISAAMVSLLSGCATTGEKIQDAELLATTGEYEKAIASLLAQHNNDPSSNIYKGALIRITNLSLSALSQQAEIALSSADYARAKNLYMRALSIDPSYSKAQSGLEKVQLQHKQQDQLALLERYLRYGDDQLADKQINHILSQNPSHPDALRMKKLLSERAHAKTQAPRTLDIPLGAQISLELRDTPLRDALNLISKSANINFILDQDIPEETFVTLFVDKAKIDDILEFIFQTYNLEKKVLNKKTILVYPITPEKKARYEDLYTRSFRIANISPDAMAELLRNVIKTNELYIEENSRSLIIRDTAETLKAAERLIALHDIAPAELILDVEIMEISTDALSNLGMEYPGKITLSLNGKDESPGYLTIKELKDLDSNSLTVGLGDPLVTMNMRRTLGSANILAKPQIRVKNREQANILIGDKVPVITSTLNQTSGFESQSVTYLDVGIKLDVTPEIFPGNEVSMKVTLEVSNIAKEIIGESGLRAYQVGTRTASTTLQLKDGETQILAGLIKNEAMNSESRVPGLGSIPGIRHLFTNENSTQKKSELILLLTPRIVRNANYPDFYESEFYSGTKDRLSLYPPALGESAEYATTTPAPDDPAARRTHEKTRSNSVPTIATLAVPATDADARLTLVAPHAIAAGQDFDVPIALDSTYTNPLKFSLSSRSKNLEILSVAPMLGEQELTQTTDAQRVTFALRKSGTARNSDILAIARIRALSITQAESALLELEPDRSENLDRPSVQGSSREIRIEAAASDEDPGIDTKPAMDSVP